ncbi:alkaline phosphatase [Aliagarivorans marinus]|uniref:alkaline phosphatase n=1 Tax=Aliagarivorans marinus TaxID=561965 RepID=UPI000684A896|nr:alkaline phosphatase [Aliagarivorans marinus]
MNLHPNWSLTLVAAAVAALVGCGSDTDTVYVDREIAESIDTGPYACSDDELASNPNKDCRLYIKGSMNSWSSRPEGQLHYQGDGLHIALFGMEDGSYSFKISDPDWSAERDLAIGVDQDADVTVDTEYLLQRKFDEFENQNMNIAVTGQDQVFRFTLDASEGIDNPTMFIENITGNDSDNLSSPMYLVGSFNDWQMDESYAFEYQGAGGYQVQLSFDQQTDIQFNIQQQLDDQALVYGALKNQLVDLKEGASALTTYPGDIMHATVEAGSYVFNISVLGDGQIAVPVSIAKVRAVSGYDKVTAANVPVSVGADGSTFAQSYDWQQTDGAVSVTLENDALQGEQGFRQLATADSEGRYQLTLTTNQGEPTESSDAHEVDVVAFDPADNIILMIGDGMGYAQIDVTRAYKGETLFLESAAHRGELHTASADTLGYEQLLGLGVNYYTDSAAAATAMSTGYKVVSGTIAQARPGDGSNLETIMQYAQQMGKSVGVVATSHCVHATPAAFVSHGPNRNDFTQLSESMFGDVKPNLALCGSKQVKQSDDSMVDVISREAAANGYTVVKNRTDMLAAIDALPATDADAEILFAGIFGEDEIPYVLPNEYQQEQGWSYDSLDIPHVDEMTQVAIDVLSRNPNGFILMVEGSQIDFAGHMNDEERMIYETLAFDDAVIDAVNWAETDGNTMVLVTADHEVGGLELIKTNGVGEIPEVSWLWGNHTNVPVPVSAWGLNSQVIQGRSVDNTSIYSIMRGALDAE